MDANLPVFETMCRPDAKVAVETLPWQRVTAVPRGDRRLCTLSWWIAAAIFCALASGCLPRDTSMPADKPRAAATRLPLASIARSSAERDLPSRRADAAAGATSFADHCQRCHGEQGAGDGPLAAALDPAPPDWTDSANMADETPAWFYRAVSRGVLGGGMQRFDTVLDEQERWDVAFFAWSRSVSPIQRRAGEALYVQRCQECHGPGGNGLAEARLDDPRGVLLSRDDQVEALRALHGDLLADLDADGTAAMVEHIYTFLYAPN